MNLFGTGGIDLVLSSQARLRSAGQGACSPVIGNGISVEDPMLLLDILTEQPRNSPLVIEDLEKALISQ